MDIEVDLQVFIVKMLQLFLLATITALTDAENAYFGRNTSRTSARKVCRRKVINNLSFSERSLFFILTSNRKIAIIEKQNALCFLKMKESRKVYEKTGIFFAGR